MSKTIIITGANGFIGSTLVHYFSGKGYAVRALVRNPGIQKTGNISYIHYDLSEKINETALQNADYLVHCAYVRDEQAPNAYDININGTTHLLEAARKNNLKKIVFLSSMSALPDATTSYGKQKYELQQLFNRNNEAVIRPGLVIGNGGVYKEIETFISRHNMIPLIDGGEQPLQVILVNELIPAIEKLLEPGMSGIYTVASRQPISMKQLYQYICKGLNKKVRYVHVPYFLVYLSVSFLNLLGIKKLPVSKESLLGIKNMKLQETKSDLEKLSLSLTNITVS